MKTRHWREGFFVAEGEKVVRRLLSSGHKVVSLLLTSRWFETLRPILEEKHFGALDVFIAPDEMLESITGVPMHQKIMAVGNIPPNPSLEELSHPHSGTNIHVALEGIADAENMGMIVRNCAAFGVESLVTGRDSTHPYLRRSIRVSMGTIFSLRTYRSSSLHETLRDLRDQHGWRVVGTVPQGGRTIVEECLSREGLAAPICLLFGGEGSGLSDEARTLCDAFFTIPMHGNVDSLNVANATAVILYTFIRVATPPFPFPA
ncbi:MAG: RNA methyltransferase [Bacteroidota bacterium]|nr:RNA methyltransferase [Bacteroidota bacterium]